ncbi:CDC42 small effector protein 2-like [Branchiostoma floridae]|uniref:CDC42 small effector protein 2-like n=1 Tax=Branchiostoma floridae TaxID=7739 RepID=A0A9J7MJS5_BRAFL|nr:CDC42 small effector protein 2-like [Branchiostoma floridae]
MKMSETWVCFSCCYTEQPQPRRKRIDRTMIGQPTNFVHTGHIGHGDMAGNHDEGDSVQQQSKINSVQLQMRSKGGYDHSSPVNNYQIRAVAVGDLANHN